MAIEPKVFDARNPEHMARVKKYAIKQPSGGVSVMTVYQLEALDKIIADFNAVSDFQITKADLHEIAERDIPQDKTFRNAWTFDEGTKKFDQDINKAKDIHIKKAEDALQQEAAKLKEERELADIANDSARVAQIDARIAQIKNEHSVISATDKNSLPNNIEDLKNHRL